MARESNDELAAAVRPRTPTGSSATPPLYPKDVDGAVEELERAVTELGLRGWKTHSNFGDSFLDEKRYWPILAKAEELGVPVYLHPAAPMIPSCAPTGSPWPGPPSASASRRPRRWSGSILSGALDAFPRLQIILGHYGEGLPFLMQRIDHPFVRPYIKADGAAVPDLKHPPSYYLRTNMWVSTSGNYLPAAFECTRDGARHRPDRPRHRPPLRGHAGVHGLPARAWSSADGRCGQAVPRQRRRSGRSTL